MEEKPSRNIDQLGMPSAGAAPSHEKAQSDNDHHSSLELTPSKADSVQKSPNMLQLVSVFVGISFSVFCTAIDRAIVTTAIPKITTDFNSLDDVGWYGSAYLLTMCSFQLFFGKLYAELNVKWVFLISLAIFEIGSIVCAAAPNSVSLIIGRAVAGMGASGLLSGALIIIGMTVPLHQRPMFTGAIGGLVGIGQVVAPTLGGVFTDKLTWRWCFWINLPLGAVTFLSVIFLLKVPPKPPSNEAWTLKGFIGKFDFIGLCLLMPWVICLLLALQWGGVTYPWSNWRLILLLVLFCVLLLGWLLSQHLLGEKATVPLRLMRQRTLASGCLYMFCLASGFFIVIYYLPFWFQSVLGKSAFTSGIDLLAISGATSAAVILAGILVSKVGYYVPVMISGTILTSVGAGLIYMFDRHTTTGFWIAALIVNGFGIGLGIQQANTAAQAVFKGADMSRAISTIIFVQSLSGTVLLAAAENTFQSRVLKEVKARVPSINPQEVVEAGASDLYRLMKQRHPQQLDAILDAYNAALQYVFLIGLVMFCLSALGIPGMEWVNVKKAKSKASREKKESSATASEAQSAQA